jgi:AraC family transcriptional regulator, regulatory protein of adaptative response / methylated-DNA-[protein]-cysteine methyltransferase
MRVRRDGPLTFKRREDITFGTGRSSLGPVVVAASVKGIVSILLGSKGPDLIRNLGERFPQANLIRNENEMKQVVSRVLSYVESPIGILDLPLDLRGTPFQKRVWEEVRKIPIGETSTYSRIAERIDAPKAIRAVANTCAANRFAFAVPCHRVLHKDGTGYGSSRARQDRFLKHEAKALECHERSTRRSPRDARRAEASRWDRRETPASSGARRLRP